MSLRGSQVEPPTSKFVIRFHVFGYSHLDSFAPFFLLSIAITILYSWGRRLLEALVLEGYSDCLTRVDKEPKLPTTSGALSDEVVVIYYWCVWVCDCVCVWEEVCRCVLCVLVCCVVCVCALCVHLCVCVCVDPPQPPPVSSMLASQTSPPGGAEKMSGLSQNVHCIVLIMTTCDKENKSS